MSQPPETDNGLHERMDDWDRRDKRRRHHRHSLRRRVFRTAAWSVLGLAGLVFAYFLLGWIADSTYTIDHLFR